MKANELRIGNIVLDPQHYGGEKEIEIDSVNYTHETKRWYDGLKPIQLTEEWLLKFGFEFNMDSKCWADKLCVHIKDNKFYILYEQGRVWVQYVHQLQNIYFALTNEELILI